MPRHGGHDLINLSPSWAHQPAANVKGFLLSCLRINGLHERGLKSGKGPDGGGRLGPQQRHVEWTVPILKGLAILVCTSQKDFII